MPRVVKTAGTTATKKGKRGRVAIKKRRKPVKLRARKRQHRLKSLPTIVAEVPMTEAMVDRLYWRAGFGPDADVRKAWTGKPAAQVVDALLNTPQGPLQGTAPLNNSKALAPKASDTDLVLEWVDRMLRVPNPLPERLTLLWHGHWANSRDDVNPPQAMMKQNELLRKYSDLGANPAADVRTMSYDLATDPAMLRYLTGEFNVRGKPNENYAREVMELFLLGVNGPDGRPNYSEDDVKELARAYSGWRLDEDDPNDVTSFFTPSRWDTGTKTLSWGKSGAFKERDATEAVLQHPNHPAYMVRKLWDHFIPVAPTAETMAALTKAYTSSNLQIKPVLRQILLAPELYSSIDEPNMIKPPVVYVVGVMKALKAPITDGTAVNALSDMGQRPYFPPTVAGWEGGLSWLNSNTVLSRYRFVGGLVAKMTDLANDNPAETPQGAFDRAFAACGAPWLSAASKAALVDYANRAAAKTAAQRKNRQIVLRTLMLAGPDGQVM